MGKTSFLALVILSCLAFPSLCLGAARKIPVYPGSVIDIPMDGEGECCDFSTADSLGKVAAYYRAALGGEPLTLEEAAKRYPALGAKFLALKKEIPAGALYRAIPLSPGEGESPDTPVFFELFAMAGLVNFTVPEKELAESDAHYAAEFRARTGRATVDEQAEAAKKEAERAARARAARDDRLWRNLLKESGVAVYPDGVYTQSFGPRHADLLDPEKNVPLALGVYESYGLYEKIRDFYGARLKEVSEETIPARREVSPFAVGEANAGRSYTSKSRAGQGRAYFAGQGCVDVAIVEGRGGEGGQKITRIIFDLDPKCEETQKLSGELWGQ